MSLTFKSYLQSQETEEDLDKLIKWGKSFLQENFEEIREFSLRADHDLHKGRLKAFRSKS